MANVKKKGIEKLCTDLTLTPPGKYTQDWEHEVVVDETRLAEFVAYYQNQNLDDDTKFTLMGLMVQMFEDSCRGLEENRDLWAILAKILVEEQDIHAETIRYWSLLSDGYDETFYATLYMRPLLEQLSRENLYKVCIFDIGYEVSVADEWRKLLMLADVGVKFLIDGNHMKGIAYEIMEVMRFKLQFYVSKVVECPEQFDEGLTIFKFESVEFPEIVFYTGNKLNF